MVADDQAVGLVGVVVARQLQDVVALLAVDGQGGLARRRGGRLAAAGRGRFSRLESAEKGDGEGSPGGNHGDGLLSNLLEEGSVTM